MSMKDVMMIEDIISDNNNNLAPRSTALSNGIWTNARAGYLDKLNQIGALPSVKSVQRGIAATVNSSTIININAVNLNKAIVLIDLTTLSYFQANLKSSTQIAFNCDNMANLAWQVIEFY